MKIVMYTKQDYCPYCENAKNLLTEMRIPYEELVIGKDVTRADFLAVLPLGTTPTVPQLYIDDIHIGGYTQLAMYMAENYGGNSETFISDLKD